MPDKILFFTDLWFYNFAVAKFLQNHNNYEMYAILDVEDKARNFFDTQKLVTYSKQWYFQDFVKKPQPNPDIEYLKTLEKKYDFDLWQLIYGDRFFHKYNRFYQFNQNEIFSLIEQECKFYEKVLDEINPDFLSIFYTIHHHQELIRKICLARGIKILMLVTAPFGHRMMLVQDGMKMDNLVQSNNSSKQSLSFDELIEYKKKFDSKEVAKDYSRANFTSNRYKRYSSIFNYFLSNQTNSNKNKYSNYGKTKSRVFRKKLSNRFQKFSRSQFINKNFNFDFPKNAKFVNFFMHYEPERILSLGAPYFTGQDDVIGNIAKSLPVEYELYVKEHPIQQTIGWRPISYYKKIMELPNVKMIHPSVSSELLLEKCSLTVTINGTVGIESLFHKKPVVTFSENFYSSIPSVRVVKNLDNLSEEIRFALKTKINEQELNEFVQQVDLQTFPLHYTLLEADFSFRFGFKGPIMDSELNEQEIEKFISDYEDDYEKLANEHIKKIEIFKKNKLSN